MSYRPTQFTTSVTSQKAGPPDNVSASSFSGVGLPEFRHVRRHVRRPKIRVMSNRLAFLLSLVFHVVAPIGLGVLTLLLMLVMGMHLEDMFMKVKPKPRDIEFVLVPDSTPEQMPVNKKTLYRAHKNTRASGEHRPDRPLNLDRQAQNSTPAVAQAPAKPVQQPKPTPAPAVTHAQQEVKPQPAMVAPVAEQTAKPEAAPAEPVAPAVAEGQKTASAGAPQSGSMANAQGGNKLGPPGVDALGVADLGPYMKDLQIRIKQSFHPPRNSETKRVILKFRIRRDGSLETVNIAATSNDPYLDQAAVAAVHEVFPFRPLPKELADEGIDIEFSFDYNVFGDKQRLKRRLDNG